MGAALAVSTRRGVDGDPLPLAHLPLQHAPHQPELNASPHKVVPKGLFGFLQRNMLLLYLPGTAGGTRVPPGICRPGLVDAILGAPRQLLPQVHHVVGNLAFELNRTRNFADFSSPQPNVGFRIGQEKSHPQG